MPKSRQAREVWQITRRKVWERDGGKCQHCGKEVSLEECNIDHIKSGLRGTNHLNNLRTLCRRCHVLRNDGRHSQLIGKALEDGIIPSDWRSLVWEG
jgi:5-methylcytosine-specific restriction endonuclease McrA